MPTYDYACDACGHRFEHFQSMSSRKLRTCPKCKAKKLRRLVGSGAGVIFKGSGFYETDYKRAGSSSNDASSKEAASTSDASGGSSSETKSSESTSTSDTSSSSSSKSSDDNSSGKKSSDSASSSSE